MIPELLKQQIDQWFDGELPESERHDLGRSLERFPDALEYFCDRGLLHQMLAEASAFSAAPKVPAQLPQSVSRLFRGTRWRLRAVFMAVTAVVAVVVLCLQVFLRPAAAGPAELVRRTLAEFQSSTDRCYTVHVESGGLQRRTGFRRRIRLPDSTLWVRGNRFAQEFEAEDGRLVWGRNSAGAVWFSVSGTSAAIFESSEVPEVLSDACDLRTLQLPTLLETLLSDYDLEYSSQRPETSRVLARPRSVTMSSKYGDIEIDIDPQSLLVRRVALERLRDQRVVAVVSFSLVEVRSREESLYELTAHLEPAAEVLDHSARAGGRSELLREFLQTLRAAQPEPLVE